MEKEQNFSELFPSLDDEHSTIQVIEDEQKGVMIELKIYEQQTLMNHCYDKQVLQAHLACWMQMAKRKDPALIRYMFEVYQECEWQEDPSEGP